MDRNDYDTTNSLPRRPSCSVRHHSTPSAAVRVRASRPQATTAASNSRSTFKSQCDKWLQKLNFVIKFT